MKRVLNILILITILNCNKNNDELIPETFEVAVTDLNLQSAIISWKLPNVSGNVYYDIILADKEIASEISENNFTINNLKIGTSYSGKVIAQLSNGSRSVGEFFFTTKGVIINPELNTLLFDLDDENKSLIATVNWNSIPGVDGKETKYNILLDGHTKASGVTTNFYEFKNLQQSSSYRVTVQAVLGGDSVVEEIIIETPSIEGENELLFDIETNYIGYTAVNFQLNSLKTGYKNSIWLTTGKEGSTSLLHEDYDYQELLISNLPLRVRPDFTNENKLKVVSMKNETLGSVSSFTFRRQNLYKLPEGDLDAIIFNIQDNSAMISAYTTSNTFPYQPAYTKPTFNIYIWDEFWGEYECNGNLFHTIDNLEPGTGYTMKVEVSYNNAPVDTNYEPNIEMTTSKEFEFTTYENALESELDVHTTNLSSTGFDFTWRTDLSGLYNCSNNNDYDYKFTLEINGVENQTFDTNSNPINVNNLENNTTYTIKLICDYFYVPNNNIIQTRVSEFEITTLE